MPRSTDGRSNAGAAPPPRAPSGIRSSTWLNDSLMDRRAAGLWIAPPPEPRQGPPREWVTLPKSSSFETRRKRDAPQDEDLELGFHLILRRPRSGRLEGSGETDPLPARGRTGHWRRTGPAWRRFGKAREGESRWVRSHAPRRRRSAPRPQPSLRTAGSTPSWCW